MSKSTRIFIVAVVGICTLLICGTLALLTGPANITLALYKATHNATPTTTTTTPTPTTAAVVTATTTTSTGWTFTTSVPADYNGPQPPQSSSQYPEGVVGYISGTPCSLYKASGTTAILVVNFTVGKGCTLEMDGIDLHTTIKGIDFGDGGIEMLPEGTLVQGWIGNAKVRVVSAAQGNGAYCDALHLFQKNGWQDNAGNNQTMGFTC